MRYIKTSGLGNIRVILITLAMLFLGSCASVNPYHRTYQVKAAKKAYTDCLKSKNNSLECEQLKRVWEVEIETYKAFYPPPYPKTQVIIRDRGGQVIQPKKN